MSHITNAVVLVTGAASGIGRRVAERCLARGARHVIAWDVAPAALEATLAEWRAGGQAVSGAVVDVTDTTRVREAAGQALAAHGTVDILVNNAGIVVGKTFDRHTHADIDRTLAVNSAAPMHLALELLPAMVAKGAGHVVNIASAAGLVANPRMSVYCASKWAVVGWSDTLYLELRRQAPGVRVTTVTPYYANTGMFAGVRSPNPLLPIVSPESVARAIVRGIERNYRFVRVPLIIRLLPLFRGLLPGPLFDLVVGKGFGVYASMEHFTGRPGEPS
jgi:all-trans-retinol dehydrogenase (NAD+)